MSETETAKANALDIINAFIQEEGFSPLSEEAFGDIIATLNVVECGTVGFSLVNAIKAIRYSTGSRAPVKWNTDFNGAENNSLVNIIRDKGFTTGNYSSTPGLSVKKSADIAKFIRANLEHLTEQ